MDVGAHSVPTGATFSILLVAHIATAIVAMGSIAMTGVYSGLARRGPSQPGADQVRRFFRPGINWPARVIYAVPVLGFALVAESKGAFATSDTFVLIGLGIWALSALLAETVVWPGERRVQEAVTSSWERPPPGFLNECSRLLTFCIAIEALLVIAFVIMFSRP